MMRVPAWRAPAWRVPPFVPTVPALDSAVSVTAVVSAATLLVAVAMGVTVAIKGPSLVALGLVAVVAATALVLLSWQQLFYVIFAVMMVEGGISLIFFGQSWPLLMKDVLTALLYAKFIWWMISHQQPLPPRPAILLPFSAFTLWCVIQSANPDLPHPMMGIVGLRTLVYYIPLAWVAYYFFSDWQTVRRFLSFNFVLGAVSCLVATGQYVMGVDWVSSLGPGFKAAAWVVGGQMASLSGEGVYRPMGTFSSTGHLGQLLLALMIMAFVALQITRSTKEWVLHAAVTVILVMGLFVNSQRATLVIVLAAVPIMLAMQARHQGIGRMLVLVVLLATSVGVAAPIAGSTFSDRFLSFAVDPRGMVLDNHLLGPTGHRVSLALSSTLIGKGTGTATIGSRYLAPLWEEYESYIAGIIYQLGLPGLLFFCSLMAVVLWTTFTTWRQVPSSEAKWIAVGILMYQIGTVIMLLTYAWLQYSVTLLYFWSLTGLAGRLTTLPANDREVESQAAALPIGTPGGASDHLGLLSVGTAAHAR